MTDSKLAGRVAIVTGASRGIGLAIAQHFVRAGALVTVTSRSQQAAEQAAAHIGSNAIGIAAHAADTQAAQTCINTTIDTFGRLDIVVNNAGTNPAFGPVLHQDKDRFNKIFDVNLWGPLTWSSQAVKAGLGAHPGATIINIASIGGLSFEPGLGLYNATKAALIHLTQQLALELSPQIRVNAICPGITRTKLAELLWKNNEPQLNTTIPRGRIGEPEDIARAAVFLASEAADWITGEVMVVDGGQILGNPELFHHLQ